MSSLASLADISSEAESEEAKRIEETKHIVGLDYDKETGQHLKNVFLVSEAATEPRPEGGDTTIAEITDIAGSLESPILRYYKPQVYSQFVSLQKWEGTVTDKKEDFFNARLIDLTGNAPDEEAEFALEEVDEDDITLVQIGAIFYWSIGYYKAKHGQRQRTSLIRFRRLPVWTASEIEKAKEKARKFKAWLEQPQ